MRAARIASCFALSLVVIPACSDDVSTPVNVSWLEWADSVTAGMPFGVHVYGIAIGHRTSLRLRIHVDRDTVTIEPYSVEPPCRGSCPDIFFGYDTLVWVPAIAATTPRRVTMRAPTASRAVIGLWPLMTFGTLTVSPDTVVQPLMHSVGAGAGFQDGLGCSFITHLPAQRLISADQAPAWTPGFSGLIYGRVDLVAGSPCVLDAPVILVDSIVT